MFEHFTSDESEDNRIERASLRACVLACVRASRPFMIQAMPQFLLRPFFQPVVEPTGFTWWRLWAWRNSFDLATEFGDILGGEVAAASPAAYALRGTTYFLVVVCVF